jgi:hypothetical protein
MEFDINMARERLLTDLSNEVITNEQVLDMACTWYYIYEMCMIQLTSFTITACPSTGQVTVKEGVSNE